jgi:hypothetical protein
VVDLAAGKWVRSISGFKKSQGALFVPVLNKLSLASDDDGMVRVFRGDTFELLDSIHLDTGPNRIIDEPNSTAPIATGWSEPVPGREFHPQWTNALHGAPSPPS